MRRRQIIASKQAGDPWIDGTSHMFVRSIIIKTSTDTCLVRNADAVQAADVYRVAQNMLQSKPILSAYGDLQHLGGYEQLCGALHRAMGG